CPRLPGRDLRRAGRVVARDVHRDHRRVPDPGMAARFAADVVRPGVTAPAAHHLPWPVRLAAALAPLREVMPPGMRTHVRIMSDRGSSGYCPGRIPAAVRPARAGRAAGNPAGGAPLPEHPGTTPVATPRHPAL